MDKLKKQAEELGIKVDGRWSEERLQEEINEALALKADAAAEAQRKADEDARLKAEALAEIEAREAALAAQESDEAVTIINLQANPMKVLGLKSYGEAKLTAAQMADPRFTAKVERARLLGLIKVK
jgi:ribosomal protein L15